MSRRQFIRRGGRSQGRPLPPPQENQLPAIPTRAQLEAAGIKICIGIPMERNVTDTAFPHFWNIARRGWPLIDHLYGRTDVNRNRMAEVLLQSDYTHVMMLDLDHIHSHDIVERHARWVLQDPERLIVSGLHFRRGEPYEPCAFVFAPDGDLHAPVEWPAGLVRVDATGHGSILISRKVFEQLEKPYWAYSYAHAKKGTYPSEDMYFSWICREAGIKMWCDTTITSPHLITGLVDESVFRQWMADNPQRVLNVDGQPHKNGKNGHQRVSKSVSMPDMKTRIEA